jgi:hypothetical protein
VYPKSNSAHKTQPVTCKVSTLKEAIVLTQPLGATTTPFQYFFKRPFCVEKIVHIVYHNISMYAQGGGEPVFVVVFFFFGCENLSKGNTIM